MDIKEEFCFPDFCSENEGDTKELVNKVKIETVTNSSDIKPELEDSRCYSQNEEHDLMRFNEAIKESKMETKIEINEEDWWLEIEDSCINVDIKNESHEDYCSTKLPSLYKGGVSSYTEALCSTEDLENGARFNMNYDRAECENDGKIISMASSSKQSKLLQQGNTNNQDTSENYTSLFSHKYRNSFSFDVSEKCLKHPPNLQKYKLILDCQEANKCDTQDMGLNKLSSTNTHKLFDDEKGTHKCNICNKPFTHLSSLKTHKLIHEGIKPHKCDICNKAFTESSSLKKHKLYHDGIKPHKCNICHKGFTQLSNLKTHQLIHEGLKPHKCNICKKGFTQLSNLKTHKLIHEGIKPYRCNICNKDFTRSSILKKHELLHKSIKPHKRNVCKKDFTRLSILKEPCTDTSDLSSTEDLVSGVSLNINNDSGEFDGDRKCQGQERVVTDIPPTETISVYVETSHDGKIVSMPSSLKQNKLLQQGSKDKQHITENCKAVLCYEYRYSCECDVSEERLKHPTNLQTQRLVLDSEVENKCDIPDKGFDKLSSKAHNLFGDVKRTHKCNICTKAFTHSSSLKTHKLIHEGIRPHKCNICNKAFTESSSLKNHKLYHDGIKPHKCNICNKAFTQLSNLKTHQLIHGGIKPHKCNICKKAFTQLSNLKTHKRIHEGLKPHKCNICSKGFTRSAILKKHKCTHEGINPQ